MQRPITGPSLLVNLACTAFSWESLRHLFFWLKRRYPAYDSTAWRLTVQSLLSLGFELGATVAFTWLDNWLVPARAASSFATGYLANLAYSLPITLLVISLYESVYFFRAWRRSCLRAACLGKAHTRSQVAALRQQVDPHFLFNTLSALSALVGDNAPAQEFIDELARVYRYLLAQRDQPLVTVATEMAFVESYLYLHRIRHQEGMQVVSHLSAEALHRYVPPLAIQLLLENALKHNVASARRPLRIELREEAGHLLVTNNVQPKTTLHLSPGVGLRNLQQQFRLLAGRAVRVQASAARFTVHLPLLDCHAHPLA
jgi:hypothetical protein